MLWAAAHGYRSTMRVLLLDHPPASYWAVPAYLEYVQPALTPAVIAAAEAQLGVRLPAAYLAILGAQNGGYLRRVHDIANTVYGIGPAFPSITLDNGWWRPKNADPDEWAPERPDLLIPFDGGGHWDMCFDYRISGPEGEPSVTFVDIENEAEKPVAADFVAYLRSLEDDTEVESVRLYGVELSSVARALASQLGAPAPTVDSLAHGYPTWRISMPGDSEWGWCTPNRVPAGFRREGKRVVVTEETALRIPEDPDCTVFVAATEDSRGAVSEALRALGWSGRENRRRGS